VEDSLVNDIERAELDRRKSLPKIEIVCTVENLASELIKLFVEVETEEAWFGYGAGEGFMPPLRDPVKFLKSRWRIK
jgi:hypothetical protein